MKQEVEEEGEKRLVSVESSRGAGSGFDWRCAFHRFNGEGWKREGLEWRRTYSTRWLLGLGSGVGAGREGGIGRWGMWRDGGLSSLSVFSTQNLAISLLGVGPARELHPFFKKVLTNFNFPFSPINFSSPNQFYFI